MKKRHPAEIIARIGIRVERTTHISTLITYLGGDPRNISGARAAWWLPQVTEPWRAIGRAGV